MHSVTAAIGIMKTQRAVECTMMMILLLVTSAALGTMSTLIHAECTMMTISRLENCAALAMVETGNSVALTTISRLPIPSVMDAHGTLRKACGLSAVCTTMMIS